MTLSRKIDIENVSSFIALDKNTSVCLINDYDSNKVAVQVIEQDKTHKLEVDADEIIKEIAAYKGHLLTFSNKRIAIWDVIKNKARTIFQVPDAIVEDTLNSMIVSPSGKIVSSHRSGSIYLWDLAKQTPELLYKQKERTHVIPRIQFMPNGKVLVLADLCDSARRGFTKYGVLICDADTKKNILIHNFKTDDNVGCSALSDHQILYYIGSTVYLLEVDKDSKQEPNLLFKARLPLRKIQRLSDTTFAYTNNEGELSGWDVSTQKTNLFYDCAYPIIDLCVTPDFLLAANTIKGIFVFDLGLQQKKRQEFNATQQAIQGADTGTKLPDSLTGLITDYAVESRANLGIFTRTEDAGDKAGDDLLQDQINLLHAASGQKVDKKP